MTNKEVFEKYSNYQFIVETQVYDAIREYWEKHCQKYGSQPPANIVGFVKGWMKQESIADTDVADWDKAKTESTDGIIDVEFREIR